jgi:CheY-like chemotaxis protein
MIDLNAAVFPSVAELRSSLAHISVDFRPAPEPAWISAWESEVEEIVSLLTDAGAAAMCLGGALYISISRTRVADSFAALTLSAPIGEYVVLAVTDTGDGSQPGDSVLTAVRGLAGRSGGLVSEHRSPGIGSVVRVLFPAAMPNRMPAPPDGEKTPGGTESILLVEDEPHIRNYVAGVLSEHGYTVLSAGTAQEATETAARPECEIDLLITDMAVSGFGGAEIIAAVRSSRPGIPVLRMSGQASELTAPSADAILQKPFRPSVLLRRIRMLLDSPPSQPCVAGQAQNPPSPLSGADPEAKDPGKE